MRSITARIRNGYDWGQAVQIYVPKWLAGPLPLHFGLEPQEAIILGRKLIHLGKRLKERERKNGKGISNHPRR